jgi:Fis family transcriptional regulator
MNNEKSLELQKINQAINDEYGLDQRTPITDTQQSLRLSVATAMDRYFDNLGGQTTVNLYDLVMTEVETPLLMVVLEYTKNNQSKAAEILGLNRGTLRKKLKQYDLL